GRVVVNASGVFSAGLRRMDDSEAPAMIAPSQGVHIGLDREFLPGDSAIMVPKTDDVGVLSAIPWLGRVVVGMSDTSASGTPVEPVPMEAELDFLLEHAGRYLTRDPGPQDVLSTFAGLRPLVNDGGVATATAALARDHTLLISASGLVTIAGGKWTTYRKMAEDTVDQAALIAGLDERACVTRNLHIHGHHHHAEQFGSLWMYGSDAPALRSLLRERPELDRPLHRDHHVTAGEVLWAARHEMARTVEDFLSRRSRLLLLDARASMEAAPEVAALLAAELGRNEVWQRAQVEEYRQLARGYLINNS